MPDSNRVQFRALERKRIEKDRDQLLQDLRERIKELTCLYEISKLIDKPGITLEEIIRGTVDLLPPAWQYPEVTCARTIFEDQIFQTDNFRETQWSQSSGIKVHGETLGSVEVYYLEEKPEDHEGPFLKEERDLIDAIAERLGGIIESKQMEKQLQQSNMEKRAILDGIPDAINLKEWDFRIKWMNEAYIKFFDSTEEELLGKHCFEHMFGLDEPHENCPVQRVFETNVAAQGVLETPDGRFLSIKAEPIRDASNEVTGVIEIITDITERRRMEKELREYTEQIEELSREHEERFREIFEESPIGIELYDADG